MPIEFIPLFIILFCLNPIVAIISFIILIILLPDD